MAKGAYYSEWDPFAADWLRNLIDAGHIAPGDVDTRSIVEVQPDDLKGYTQCHFFAGIGVWSYALRLAGWPDDRPVWTGSCPCQPFSVAGLGRGTDDARHLWPEWFRLIRECRPPVAFGEQVAGAAGRSWLAAVRADLESAGYAVGAADLPAAGISAPHIRQRLWFVAHTERGAAERHGHALAGASGRDERAGPERERVRVDAGDGGEPDGLGDAIGPRPQVAGHGRHGDGPGRDGTQPDRPAREAGAPGGGLGDAEGGGFGERGDAARSGSGGHAVGASGAGLGGPWADLVWLPCRDGKARPTQPAFQFVVDGITAGMGAHWDACEKAIQEVVSANAEEAGPGEVVRTLWQVYAKEAIRERAAGGSERLSGPEILLVALCEYARHMGAESHGTASGVPTLTEGTLRILRGAAVEPETPARPPQKWRLAGPPARELADAVHPLSPAWRAWRQHALALSGQPLTTSVPNRTGLLRAFGNAIVAPLAAEVIRAYMETES